MMVSQIKPVLCPKCKRSVLGIGRSFGGQSKLVTVEVHHHEDAAAYNAGGTPKTCKFKMTYADSQALAESISSDLGGRK